MGVPLITIFTPTYNRALYLPKLYQSLCSQTNKSFKWLIVDDGSGDDTQTLVATFKEEKKIVIDYIYQNNQGKHIAINTGVANASSELFFIVDSDDFLLPTSIETLLKVHENNKHRPHYAGVVGRRVKPDGSFLGPKLKEESTYIDFLSFCYNNQFFGDLAEAYLTKVLKAYPFPVIANEKFIAEGIVWYRIAQKYKLFFFNQGIYVSEYLQEGLTNNVAKIRMKSPKLSMLYYSEYASYSQLNIKAKIKAVTNFWRFSFHDQTTSFFNKLKKISFLYSIIGLPLGYAMYLRENNTIK